MRITKSGPITISIIGLGGRSHCYLRALDKLYPNDYVVVAVADPVEEKRNEMVEKYHIPAENIFSDYREFIKKERLSDVVIIGTLDNMHYEPAMQCIKLGYDMILEKPIGFTLEQTVEIGECARKHPDQFVAVCHVLRHTPFFTKIKEILDSGELGKVVDIQHNENVGYYHFAHSYVRGSWRNTDTSTPFIVAKCCHDLDILLYLLGDKKCLNISSMGSLTFFRKENYNPKTMGLRCTSCPSEESCPYSAIKIYKNGLVKSIVFDLSTPQKILDTFETSSYGKCVFQCDNNVPDHQVTAIEFSDGVHATFNVSGFTKLNTRTLKIMCEYGEIRAIGKTKTIEVIKFNSDEIRKIVLPDTYGGHGGGDEGFIKNFMEAYLHHKKFSSTIDMSIESHVMAFAAEESRLAHGKVINIPTYWEEEIKKIK